MQLLLILKKLEFGDKIKRRKQNSQNYFYNLNKTLKKMYQQ